ncbi:MULTISPECIES: glutaredoxin family protein [Desulfosediminicola]|uniref:glutaredoxin family protein n=1 Tax=Desulfosediminicola TaxID=2886823 RepID=UPI0010AB7B93|nr:glutaredoxin family protein [Desulfosediminicola ganghwensis]
MATPPVRLFALSTCIHCKALKKLLTRNNITFEWTDVDLLPKEERDHFFAQIAEHNPKKSFPIVMIGNKAIIGDQRKLILKELGLVDEQ